MNDPALTASLTTHAPAMLAFLEKCEPTLRQHPALWTELYGLISTVRCYHFQDGQKVVITHPCTGLDEDENEWSVPVGCLGIVEDSQFLPGPQGAQYMVRPLTEEGTELDTLQLDENDAAVFNQPGPFIFVARSDWTGPTCYATRA